MDKQDLIVYSIIAFLFTMIPLYPLTEFSRWNSIVVYSSLFVCLFAYIMIVRHLYHKYQHDKIILHGRQVEAFRRQAEREAEKRKREMTCPDCKTIMEYPYTECKLCGWVVGWLVKKREKQEKQERSRHIPRHVQREVWRRDQGRCVECGSNINLEYDHIVPFSRGGSNTTRNIQLLCEECNRKKSNNI